MGSRLGGRSGAADDLEVNHEINVTPFIDLMEVMNMLRNAGYLKIALVGLDGRAAPQ